MKKMPEEIVDLGITSPPYNKQEKNNGGLVSNVVYSSYRDKLPEDEYQTQQIKVLNELFRSQRVAVLFFTIIKSDGKCGICFIPWIGYAKRNGRLNKK